MLADVLMRWLLGRFETRWHYPMDYARALLAGSRRAFWHYSRLAPAAQCRDGVPRNAWHAARITAVHAEDCGPCAQLTLDQALADGVPPALLQALVDSLRRSVVEAGVDVGTALDELDPDAALAVRFAHAWAAHDPAQNDWRPRIEQRFGARGLASLAVSMTAIRMFPLLKTALGHGQACGVLQIATIIEPSR